jgi:hypothetical protein
MLLIHHTNTQKDTMTHTNVPTTTPSDIDSECKNCLAPTHTVGEPVHDDHNVAFCSLSCEDDYKEAAHPTPTRKVRKCGICRTPGHDRRKCPTLSVTTIPLSHPRPHTDLYLLVGANHISLYFDPQTLTSMVVDLNDPGLLTVYAPTSGDIVGSFNTIADIVAQLTRVNDIDTPSYTTAYIDDNTTLIIPDPTCAAGGIDLHEPTDAELDSIPVPAPTMRHSVPAHAGHAHIMGICAECPTEEDINPPAPRRRVACLPVYNHPALRYTVGCSITSPDKSVHEATPGEFADLLLHVRDLWDDDSPVVTGVSKSYLTPEDARCAMGSISAYTSEVCNTCGRVYSGADIEAHLRTHTDTDVHVTYTGTVAHVSGNGRDVRNDAWVTTVVEKEHTDAYVARYATDRLGTYMSESEGLADTTELTDAHVREDGMHMSVDVIKHPTRKCRKARCMQLCDNSPLVTTRGIEGGKSYTCSHGTQWNEVWEASYTHARWDHMRDAHLQEQRMSDNMGHFGQNPLFAYLWRQKHTRVQRMRALTTWVQHAHMKDVLRTLNSNVIKQRRNLTVAQAVGFSETPVGKWEGVDGDDTRGFFRETPYNLTYTVRFGPLLGTVVPVKTTCTRMAEWSGIYLTKADFQYITLLMERRVGKKPTPRVVLSPLGTLSAICGVIARVGAIPTSRPADTQPLTLGDKLLQKRMLNYTLRQDAEKWEKSDAAPQVSEGVPTYVNTDNAAELSTLWGVKVHTPTFSTF